MACPAIRCQNPLANPKGIASFSPGLARVREGLPWVVSFKFYNPERVESQRLTKQIQPLQGCDFFLFSPRVARGAQPWANRFNPVGIAKFKGPWPLASARQTSIVSIPFGLCEGHGSADGRAQSNANGDSLRHVVNGDANCRSDAGTNAYANANRRSSATAFCFCCLLCVHSIYECSCRLTTKAQPQPRRTRLRRAKIRKDRNETTTIENCKGSGCCLQRFVSPHKPSS